MSSAVAFYICLCLIHRSADFNVYFRSNFNHAFKMTKRMLQHVLTMYDNDPVIAHDVWKWSADV